MSTLRKYNKENYDWEPIASSDATGIYTNNSLLTLKEDGEKVSVEDILLQNRAELDLLQHNVSWLALHGGGSGVGGGVAFDFKIEIINPIDKASVISNLDTVGTIVWTNQIEQESYITYKVSSKSRATFQALAMLNGNIIQKDDFTAKNQTINIPVSTVKKYLGSGGTLSIQVEDIASETRHNVQCQIIVSTTMLYDGQLKLTMAQLDSPSTRTLRLVGKATITGNYKLYYSNNQINVIEDSAKVTHFISGGIDLDEEDGHFMNVTISNTSSQTFQIDVVESGLIPQGISNSGIYNRYFMLVNESNPNIRSGLAGVIIIITVTDGILVVPQIGSETIPYTIAKDNILPLQFAVFSSLNGTFNYVVRYKNNESPDSEYQYLTETVTGNIFNESITKNINLINIDGIQEPENENDVKIYKLEIGVRYGTITSVGYTYIKILKAKSKYLSTFKKGLENYTVFDYSFITGSIPNTYTNEQYLYQNLSNQIRPITSIMTFGNIGQDSGNTGNYYKFRHFAYAQVQTNAFRTINHWFPTGDNDSQSLILYNNWEFTFEIAYHIDEEVRDDLVIFNLGNYAFNGDKHGYGIVVTPHKLYFKIEKTSFEEDLQDNSFTQLNIVCETVSNSKYLKVYYNGKLLKVVDFIIDGNSVSGSLNKIFLGGYDLDQDGLPQNNIDFDLYSLKFYTKSLNVGQIICSYINNYTSYNYDGQFASELITKLCLNNSIDLDNDGKQSQDVSKISSIYNVESGNYTWDITEIDGIITLPDSFKNLPIPIVTLRVGWSFSEFKAGGLSPTISKFDYYDGNTHLTNDNVTVEQQGTTSGNYEIKNVKIGFNNGLLFSPKDDWLPEREFTLKADIVDSGHINNAVIGKFINYCFNNTELMNKDAFPCINKLREYQDQGTLPSTFNIKAAIEGFPCLLIVNFNNGSGVRDIQVLGIYSFNLGRESQYNQGYRIPKRLYRPDGIAYNPGEHITFPNFFSESPAIDIDTTYKSCCFEGKATHNCSVEKLPFESEHYNFAKINVNGTECWYPQVDRSSDGNIQYNYKEILDSNGNPIHYDSNNVEKYNMVPNGYFWSTDETYYGEHLWNYVGGELSGNDARIELAKLNNCIAQKIPYKKGTIQQAYGDTVKQYRIVGESGESITTALSGNPDYALVAAQSDAETIELSIQNTAFYYVIAMLFGLMDSLGKNLQMKFWKTDSQSFYWSPTFYDMDTALGISNLGNVDVTPDVLDYSLFNTQDAKVQILWGNAPQSLNHITTVYSNKLWGIENPILVEKYNLDFKVISEVQNNPNFFAQMWNNIRKTVVKNANDLFENYFESQLKDCGEFLLNYDYQIKYLDTRQVDFLHGDRLSYIKNWLNKRIVFLDSIFGYSQRIQNGVDYKITNYLKPNLEQQIGDNISMYNIPWNNQINISHNTGISTVPITSNAPVIFKTVIGGNQTQYTFAPNNVETEVIIAGNTIGDQDIQSIINNTNCIVDISKLKYLNIKGITPLSSVVDIKNLDGNSRYDSQKINLKNQYGSLSSLRVFDMSNTTSISSSLNMFQLFKTWDNSPINRKTYSFGLQEINFNNTRSIRDGIINFNLDFSQQNEGANNMPSIYNSPFINLIKIDVSGSNVSDITIPDGISLYKLNVSNSSISSLKLTNQSLLTSLDLNECSSLTAITIANCQNFTSLTFNESNKSLGNIIISGCQNLTSIVIEANSKYLDVPNVSIQDCQNLTSIIIRNCSVRTSNGNKVLTIKSCTKLSNIIVYNSNYDIISWDKNLESHSLSTFNISYSPIYALTTRTVGDYTSVDNIIDLTEISSISTLNFGYNQQVEYVKFNNIEGSPFSISTNRAFIECKKLKRVYGNIILKSNEIFYKCSSFSILGTDTTQYNGISVERLDDNDNVIGIKHFKEIDEFKNLSKLPFLVGESGQEEINVTNMTFGVGNCTNDFYNTACTILDAYYILYNIGSGTNLSELFYSASNINWTWDNSPSRYTFINCGNVTSISYIFRGTGSSLFKLYSPTFENDEIDEIGLFTPLRNCTNIEGVFLQCSSYSCDRNIFRLNGNEKFKFNNICRFNPTYIADRLDEQTTSSSVVDLFTSENMLDGEHNTIGNLDNIFYNLNSNVTMYLVFNDTKYINYSKLENGLSIPPQTQTTSNISTYSIRRSFNSVNSYGDITFDKLFRKNTDGKYWVRGIYGSFRTTGTSVAEAKLKISEDMFSDFSNIFKGIGFYGTHNGDLSSDYKDNQGDYSFKGVKKQILQSNNEFPYDILEPIKDIVIFSGFFSDATYSGNEVVEPIDKDNGIFRNCTKLQDVSYTFYNVKFKYSLSSCGFRNCTKLQDVSYLFATDAPDNHTDRLKNISQFTGQIPNKLFYHGGTIKQAQSIFGINDEIQITLNGIKEGNIIKVLQFIDTSGLSNFDWNITEDHYIEFKSNYSIIDQTLQNKNEYQFILECSPITEFNENTIIQVQDENDETVTQIQTQVLQLGDYMTQLEDTIGQYETFNKNIKYITGCFQGANIDYYSVTDNDTYINNIEFLSDYSPFKYIKSSGKWKSNTKRKLNNTTLKWVFDGLKNSSHYTEVIGSLNYSFEEPDISEIDDFSNESIYYINKRTGNDTGLKNTGNYCCAQDLLRYCKSDASVTALFKNCGQIHGNAGQYNYLYGGVTNHLQYGIKGRIPPYLFQSIYNVTDFSEMFYGCKLLGWYSKNGKYTIPETLFNYTPNTSINLSRMFVGVHFPENIKLNVFKKYTTKTVYNVSQIFKYSSFDTNNEDDRTRWTTLEGTFTNVNVINGANEVFATIDTSTQTPSQFTNLYLQIKQNFTNGKYPSNIQKVYYGYSKSGIYFNDGGSYSTINEQIDYSSYSGGQLSSNNQNNYSVR